MLQMRKLSLKNANSLLAPDYTHTQQMMNPDLTLKTTLFSNITLGTPVDISMLEVDYGKKSHSWAHHFLTICLASPHFADPVLLLISPQVWETPSMPFH